MEKEYLTSKELAKRWGYERQTLANWRSQGKGPPFMRIYGKILYAMKDIKQFESDQSIKQPSKHE
jgi:predicted site-specific integrase-resolvase